MTIFILFMLVPSSQTLQLLQRRSLCIASAVPLPRHGQRTSEAYPVEPQLHEHEPNLLPGFAIREQVLASTDKSFRRTNHLAETNSVLAAVTTS